MMNSTATGTPDSIEATTALLEAELPRLEEQQQSLEKELAVVTERLESVRTALSALKALSLAPLATVAGDAPETRPAPSASTEAELVTGPKADALNAPDASGAPADEAAAEAPEATVAPTRRKARKAPAGSARKEPAAKARKARPAEKTDRPKSAAKAGSAKKAKSPAAPAKESGGLTEQVVAILAESGRTPVRARDVAQALGRDESSGSINAVRSTLDRLVATSRAQRAGRGLYRAPAN
ncbi:hypothetical protein [Streptomyces sp. NPDC054887]